MAAWCLLVVLVVGWFAWSLGMRQGKRKGARAYEARVRELVPKIDADIQKERVQAFKDGLKLGSDIAALEAETRRQEEAQRRPFWRRHP